MKKTRILGASLGHCVHVAGILGFLNLAEQYDFETRFTGPATSLEKLASEIDTFSPDIIALSYRLTPEALTELLDSLKDQIHERGWGENASSLEGHLRLPK